MSENVLEIITSAHVCTKDFITTIATAKCIEDEKTSIVFYEMFSILDNEPRLPDEHTTEAFRIHHSPDGEILPSNFSVVLNLMIGFVDEYETGSNYYYY